jgi:hypothetical protein
VPEGHSNGLHLSMTLYATVGRNVFIFGRIVSHDMWLSLYLFKIVLRKIFNSFKKFCASYSQSAAVHMEKDGNSFNSLEAFPYIHVVLVNGCVIFQNSLYEAVS